MASDIEVRSAGAAENWEFKSINFGGDDVGGLALAAREQRLPALRRAAPYGGRHRDSSVSREAGHWNKMHLIQEIDALLGFRLSARMSRLSSCQKWGLTLSLFRRHEAISQCSRDCAEQGLKAILQ